MPGVLPTAALRYPEKLSRRGIRVGSGLTSDSLRTKAVADVMNRGLRNFQTAQSAHSEPKPTSAEKAPGEPQAVMTEELADI